jgi:hypothetical protein
MEPDTGPRFTPEKLLILRMFSGNIPEAVNQVVKQLITVVFKANSAPKAAAKPRKLLEKCRGGQAGRASPDRTSEIHVMFGRCGRCGPRVTVHN